jgi:transcriptional regulator with XRE-family HTH domain
MAESHPLKVWREANGLTQEALGRELGVTDVTISRWETGVRRIDDDLLAKVSERTGIAKSELRPDLARLLKEAAE